MTMAVKMGDCTDAKTPRENNEQGRLAHAISKPVYVGFGGGPCR
jgi:hypothetical protein